MLISRWIAVVTLITSTPALACDDTKAWAVTDPMVAQLVAEGSAHVAQLGDNVGVYAWNDEVGAYVLQASWSDARYFFFPLELLPGDEVVYVGSGVAGGEEALGCAGDDPTTLDTVQVTGSRPSRSGGGAFLRVIGYGGGGSGSLVVNRTRVSLQTEPMCEKTSEGRARNVGETIKFENQYSMGGPHKAMAYCASNGGKGLEYEAAFIGGSGRGVYRWTGDCDVYSDRVYLTEIQAPDCPK